MKFGKKLIAVASKSDPEWAPFWPNYKLLKKKIKDIVFEQEQAGNDESTTKVTASETTDLSKSATEVAFFKAVQVELRKSAEFFTSMVEQQYTIRRDRVREGFRQLRMEEVQFVPEDATTFVLRACLDVYKDLIMLENFAVMTHTAFSKILKKHDKRTGYKTREAFMQRVVAPASFARYPTLKSMLSELEQMYKQVVAIPDVHDARDGSNRTVVAGHEGGETKIQAVMSGEESIEGGKETQISSPIDRLSPTSPTVHAAEQEIGIAKIISQESLRELREELTDKGCNENDNSNSDDDIPVKEKLVELESEAKRLKVCH